MKILLILAIAMAGGLALSRLMKLLNLPNVTGYLIAGILIGPFVLKLVTNVDIKSAKIITTTALGFIAFSIGGEFKLSLLKKLGGKIVVITVVQAVMTVLLVMLALLLVPGEYRVPRALLLGAIAAATAPAATLLVVRQYKAKGPVTDTLLPVTAFDDAVGLMIFSLCFALAQAFASGDALTVQAIVLDPLREIGLSLLTGGVMRACVCNALFQVQSKPSLPDACGGFCLRCTFGNVGAFFTADLHDAWRGVCKHAQRLCHCDGALRGLDACIIHAFLRAFGCGA